MDAEFDKIDNFKDGYEQLLVYQFTRNGVEGTFYGCDVSLNEDGKIYPNDVLGAIVAIINTYTDLIPEVHQLAFEKDINDNLMRMIENRYEHIVNVAK